MKKRDMIEAMKKTLQEGWPVPRWINAWLNNLPDDIEEKPIEPEPRPTCENWFYMNVKNKDMSCLVKHEFGACCHFKDRQAEKPEPKDQPEIEWEKRTQKHLQLLQAVAGAADHLRSSGEVHEEALYRLNIALDALREFEKENNHV